MRRPPRENQYHAGDLEVREAREQRLGRPHQLHLQPPEDNQFGESNFFSRRRDRGRRTPTTSRPSTRSACSTCRTSSSFSPIVELPFGEGKRWAAERRRRGDSRRLDALVDHLVRERLPVLAERQHQRPVGPRRANAARRTRHGDRTDGSRRAHRAAAGASCTTNAARHLAELGRLRAIPRHRSGHAAADAADVRTPHRNNWDFVASKAIPLGGTCAAEIRLEVLNITNTVKVRGPTQTRRQRHVRPDPVAVGLHAPDAADVQGQLLRGLGLGLGTWVLRS